MGISNTTMKKIKEYFEDKMKLDLEIKFHLAKKNLIKAEHAKQLVAAHLDKAKHNLSFVDSLKSEFNDWKVIGLYYSLYHSSLALLANKGFISKNHNATLLFLIKNYSLSYDEIELIDQLSITKDDAEFYAGLKKERHDASYATSALFSDNRVEELKSKTISLINKIRAILG